MPNLNTEPEFITEAKRIGRVMRMLDEVRAQLLRRIDEEKRHIGNIDSELQRLAAAADAIKNVERTDMAVGKAGG